MTAHGLRLFDLLESRSRVPDREKEFRVLVQARSAVAPIHGCSSGHAAKDPDPGCYSPGEMFRTADKGHMRRPGAQGASSRFHPEPTEAFVTSSSPHRGWLG